MRITRLAFITLLMLVVVLAATPPVAAASPGFVIVRWGDTLYHIAARNGTTVEALMRANAIPNANFIYAGQRLVVPASSYAPAAPAPAVTVYTVRYGDSLAVIAARFGTTLDAMMRANNLYNPDFIYVGQRLNLPGRSAPPPPQPAPAPAHPPAPNRVPSAPTGGKWIDINISTQTISAFEGNTPLKSVLVSTGIARYPTPVGRFAIYRKIPSQTMSGGRFSDYYYLPNVPSVMYFYDGYAIHGTYWHRNFGRPMSHGCVNLTIEDAKWFYDWAEIGTPVITHY